ncbi:MAG TPA: hypothetical protein VKY19_27430 [Ktedonosporobacter sp.]|jgi:hypothetical protein|nr:hypothetical protein [Ktedonosporobacter sp.]
MLGIPLRGDELERVRFSAEARPSDKSDAINAVATGKPFSR